MDVGEGDTAVAMGSGEVPVLLVTTIHGAERIRAERLPPSVQVSALQSAGPLSARAILQAVSRVRQSEVILVEGGPQLMGDFFAEQALDELFQRRRWISVR